VTPPASLTSLIRPLRLGKLWLSSNVVYSPLSGFSDYPFRQIASRFQPGLIYCEMVRMEALLKHRPSTYHLLDYHHTMRPIGAQIFGSSPQCAGSAARIIESLGFDTVDLNCGCPVNKVVRSQSGSKLLQQPKLIGDILANMAASVNIPVTVKIRAGWDLSSINSPLITSIAEQAGAQAITIHGRTRTQKYKGPANWDYIKACRSVAKKIKVFGNGDIFDAQAGIAMLQRTNCDGISVARGVIGQPWIAEEIRRKAEKQPPLHRSGFTLKQSLLQHLDEITSYYAHPAMALASLRRVANWYLKECSGAKTLRMAINHTLDIDIVRSMIEKYHWDQITYPLKSACATQLAQEAGEAKRKTLKGCIPK